MLRLDPRRDGKLLKQLGIKETKPKRDKYGARKILRENVWWDSIWEYECWVLLKDLKRRRKISNLRRQVRYNFDGDGTRIGWYVADFVFDAPGIIDIVADAKHRQTQRMAKLRRTFKLMLAFHRKEVLIFYKGETDVQATVLQFIAGHVTL